jgi:hypothetical protein
MGGYAPWLLTPDVGSLKKPLLLSFSLVVNLLLPGIDKGCKCSLSFALIHGFEPGQVSEGKGVKGGDGIAGLVPLTTKDERVLFRCPFSELRPPVRRMRGPVIHRGVSRA